MDCCNTLKEEKSIHCQCLDCKCDINGDCGCEKKEEKSIHCQCKDCKCDINGDCVDCGCEKKEGEEDIKLYSSIEPKIYTK